MILDKLSILIIFALFIFLISIQYTLNKILLELKNIKKIIVMKENDFYNKNIYK